MNQFTHVKPTKGSDLVMEAIRQRIESNELKPGDRLPSVVELAISFQLGRSTIREALSALKAMGWLDIRHGGGTFVSKTLPNAVPVSGAQPLFEGAETLKEVLEVRKYIEVGCAALAARNRTEEDMAAMERTIAVMREVLADETRGEQADVDFHLQIAAASHNKLLLQIMESLTHKLQENMGRSRALWFYGELASAERLLQEHTGIFQAIQDKNESLAEQRMLDHLQKVDTVLQQASL